MGLQLESSSMGSSLFSVEYRLMLGRLPLALPIPTGLKHPAQGCAPRATLGGNTEKSQLSGLWFNGITQGRPSRNRANPGLNDPIPSGLKDGSLSPCDEQVIFIPPKTAKNLNMVFCAGRFFRQSCKCMAPPPDASERSTSENLRQYEYQLPRTPFDHEACTVI